MKRKLIIILFFCCLGITTEVCFTAFSDLIATWNTASPNKILEGHTYVWMIPIYALIPILFPLGRPYLKNWHILLRGIVYCLGIFVIEFVSGFLLEQMVGRCPWDYTGSSPYEVMGYIRLDYAPFWIVFGVLVEQLLLFLEKHIK